MNGRQPSVKGSTVLGGTDDCVFTQPSHQCLRKVPTVSATQVSLPSLLEVLFFSVLGLHIQMGLDRHKNKQSRLSPVGQGEEKTAVSQKAQAGLKGAAGTAPADRCPAERQAGTVRASGF